MRFLPDDSRRQLADRGMTTEKKIHPAVRMDFFVRILTYPLVVASIFSLFWIEGSPPLWLVALLAAYGLVWPPVAYAIARNLRQQLGSAARRQSRRAPRGDEA